MRWPSMEGIWRSNTLSWEVKVIKEPEGLSRRSVAKAEAGIQESGGQGSGEAPVMNPSEGR
jgi:hypothetical protein